MNRQLLQTPAFERAVRRLRRRNPAAFAALREGLVALAADAFAPALRTHKLRGDLSGLWSASAGYDLRVVFELTQHDGAEAILLVSCGTHDEVY